MSREAIVTTPPDVVRIRASSTVLVKASSRVNRDLAGIVIERPYVNGPQGPLQRQTSRALSLAAESLERQVENQGNSIE